MSEPSKNLRPQPDQTTSQIPTTSSPRPQASRTITDVSSNSSSDSLSIISISTNSDDHGHRVAPSSPSCARVQSRSSIKVPRAQRRGMLGCLAIVPEIEDPREYGNAIKVLITVVVATGGAAAPMASSIVFPALTEISKDLNATPAITNLSVALYLLAMAIFPLWWSAFSERSGRRSVYIISFTLLVIFSICAAISPNIGLLIFFRVASGGAASSTQSVGAGTIADIWDVRERGKAMGFFYLGPLCGPLLSPIIGGVLTQRFGWRATQWFLACFGLAVLLFMVFALPETLRRKKKGAVKKMMNESSLGDGEKTEGGEVLGKLERTLSVVSVKTRGWSEAVRSVLFDPLKALKYLRFPPVLLTCYYASIAFGCLYVLNVSIETTFSKPPYNFSTTIVGTLYIPSSLGYILASIVGGRWSDTIMKRAALKRSSSTTDPESPPTPLEYRPEDRMGVNAWLAAFTFPIALICYGWLAKNGIFWVAPAIALFFFGFGSMMIFGMTTTMLTEFVPGRSSSAVAVNNFLRNIFSCVGGIVARPVIDAIGNGWLFTILGVVGLASATSVAVMHRYGPKWRMESDKHEFLR